MTAKQYQALKNLAENFEESHNGEIEDGHAGDDSCSYCDAIEDAYKALGLPHIRPTRRRVRSR